MTRATEERIEEWGKWYHHHKDNIPDLKKRTEFQTLAIDGLFEIMARMAKDIQNVELKAGCRSHHLYLPTGVSVSGDMRNFG